MKMVSLTEIQLKKRGHAKHMMIFKYKLVEIQAV